MHLTRTSGQAVVFEKDIDSTRIIVQNYRRLPQLSRDTPLPSLRRPRSSNLLFNCKKGDTRPLFMHSVIDSNNHLFGKLKTCLCTQLERQRRPKIQSAFRVSGKGSVIRKSFGHNLGYLFKFQPIPRLLADFDEVSLS